MPGLCCGTDPNSTQVGVDFLSDSGLVISGWGAPSFVQFLIFCLLGVFVFERFFKDLKGWSFLGLERVEFCGVLVHFL
jgi:hypothetical protein